MSNIFLSKLEYHMNFKSQSTRESTIGVHQDYETLFLVIGSSYKAGVCFIVIWGPSKMTFWGQNKFSLNFSKKIFSLKFYQQHTYPMQNFMLIPKITSVCKNFYSTPRYGQKTAFFAIFWDSKGHKKFFLHNTYAIFL